VKRFFNWISQPYVYSIINFILAIGTWVANNYVQAFCQPVLWAGIALLVFMIAFLAWPFIPPRFVLLRNVALFMHGIGLCICVYCILFFPELLIISLPLLLIGIGAFGFIHVIFLIQICFRIYRDKTRFGKISAISGIILLCIFQIYFSLQYKAIGNEIQKIPIAERTIEKVAATLPRNYMAERFAGTHFRYHTCICLYDGWRPPLHDPFLVISRWFYPEVDETISRSHLGYRIDLYRKMFPDRNAYADCDCAEFARSGYPRNEK